MSIQKHAFLDEFGNSGFNFDKPDVSSHFIITAIIVNELDIPSLEKNINAIRKKYFQKGKIKSSKVGQNHDRRKAILKELSLLNYDIFSMVFHKKKLTSKGFGFPRSFFKFLSSLVYQELIFSFPRLKLSADPYGNENFMKGFKKYIDDKYPQDLFKYADIMFDENKSELLVQVADFICGTIARNYEENKRDKCGYEFIQILKNQIIKISEWPPDYYTSYIRDLKSAGFEFDDIIAEVSCNLAQYYISKNNDTDDFNTLQKVNCLKYLLFCFITDPNRYVSTGEILVNINFNQKNKIDNNNFRLNIIGPLRDEGMLLSSSENGYKIPLNEYDCINYVNMGSKTIIPMIKRIQKFRSRILLSTNNRLDVVNNPEHELIKKILDSIDL